jgi:hypothetical protein
MKGIRQNKTIRSSAICRISWRPAKTQHGRDVARDEPKPRRLTPHAGTARPLAAFGEHSPKSHTEQSSQQAFETARRLSQQLRAAEDRIVQLEADLDTYRQKAERAEQWLHTVYTEIEDRFLKQDAPRRARR